MEDNQTRESGGVIGSFDSAFINNFNSLKSKVNNSVYIPTLGTEYTTAIETGKMTINLKPWRPYGFYFIYLSHDGANIWIILATLLWTLDPFHKNAANGSVNDITITGNSGSGVTITVTNSNITKLESSKNKILIKGMVNN